MSFRQAHSIESQRQIDEKFYNDCGLLINEPLKIYIFSQTTVGIQMCKTYLSVYEITRGSGYFQRLII